jgi:hypothetical protein
MTTLGGHSRTLAHANKLRPEQKALRVTARVVTLHAVERSVTVHDVQINTLPVDGQLPGP